MTVAEVIAQARTGELKNLSTATDAFPDETIINYINLALLELYKRYSFETAEVEIVLHAGKTVYTLDSTDADVNYVDFDGGRTPLTVPPMHILSAFDEEGNEYTLNDENDALSIFQIAWNKIQVPNPADSAVVMLITQEAPTTLTLTTDVVPVPETMLEALLHYIGYRAHGAINGNIQAENNTHYVRFEQSLARIESLGLKPIDDLTTPPVSEKGFV